MREIKLRAWDGEKMHFTDHGDICRTGSDEFEWSPHCFVINCISPPTVEKYILMQFTGLLDKNGVEIYEGDIILDSPRYAKKRGKGIVEYDNSVYGAAFIIKEINPTVVECQKPLIIPNEETYERNFYDEMGKNFSWDEIEIIGNIHENPELLDRE